MLEFNLIPNCEGDYWLDGLERAYWGAPAGFRQRVRDSLREMTVGPFPQLAPAQFLHFLEAEELKRAGKEEEEDSKFHMQFN